MTVKATGVNAQTLYFANTDRSFYFRKKYGYKWHMVVFTFYVLFLAFFTTFITQYESIASCKKNAEEKDKPCTESDSICNDHRECEISVNLFIVRSF